MCYKENIDFCLTISIGLIINFIYCVTCGCCCYCCFYCCCFNCCPKNL